MFFNLMELWTVVIASSAAPLWPLFKALSQKPPVKTIFASFASVIALIRESLHSPIWPIWPLNSLPPTLLHNINLPISVLTHSSSSTHSSSAPRNFIKTAVPQGTSTSSTMKFTTSRELWLRIWKSFYGEGIPWIVCSIISPSSQIPCVDHFPGMSHLSTSLRSESEKYRKAARNINVQAMLRQYAPLAAVVFIIIVLAWWRFSWVRFRSVIFLYIPYGQSMIYIVS